MTGDIAGGAARRSREVSGDVDELRFALSANGSAWASARDVDVAAWRSAARAVGRSLGRPLRTLVVDDVVHAMLQDWPANDAERAVHDEAKHRAVLAAARRRDALLDPQ